MIKEKITDSIFPREEDIPDEFRLKKGLIQREYLVDGKLRVWDGRMHEVYSPVHIRTSDGLSPKALGKFPFSPERNRCRPFMPPSGLMTTGEAYGLRCLSAKG